MSEYDFHPLVKQLLDGDITIADLPAELRAEGEEALRLLAAVDRSPVALPAILQRVMRALTRPPQRFPRWLLARGVGSGGGSRPSGWAVRTVRWRLRIGGGITVHFVSPRRARRRECRRHVQPMGPAR